MARDVHPGEIGKTFFLALFCTVNRIFVKTGSGQTQGTLSTHTQKRPPFRFFLQGKSEQDRGDGWSNGFASNRKKLTAAAKAKAEAEAGGGKARL